MIDEEKLSEVVSRDVNLSLVEPHIYSIYPSGEDMSSYDKTFGTIYDLVGCNRLYNRLVWGYWTVNIIPYASMLSDHHRMGGY
jgi:hypothetical protein